MSFENPTSPSPEVPENTEPTKKDPRIESEEKESIFNANERFKFEVFTDSLRRISGFLREREQDRLNQLIPEREAYAFSGIGNQIGELVLSKEKKDIEEVENLIRRLIYVFEQFGKAPPERMVRDGSDNLRRGAFLMNSLSDTILDLRGVLGGSEKPEYESLLSLLRRTQDLSQKVAIWLSKKAGLLEGRSRY